ncbi:MAG: hypothetical protein Q4A84_09210 [Neisseria sp.]|uniref:hypothetical protein n=1 Tax=Neisseria sp. TaxID=192066 RepID=UPI0026DCD6B5|nr:hypothetical protein [Neisseria sp.]MDO4641856.1 hypothetical protein [Neisseria sp.]
MHLTIAVPALNLEQTEPLPPLETPALNTLLRFGSHTSLPTSVANFFAAYLWQGSLLAHAKKILGLQEKQYAVFASPVWQQMGMHNVNMLGGSDLGITLQEAQAFCAGLSEFYADSALNFHAYRPDLWVVALPTPVDWQVPCILDVMGMLDGTVRAEGQDAELWLQLQTEIQMWLHSHPLNVERTQNNQPAINGIWLWQNLNGTLTDSPLLAADNEWAEAYQGPKLDLPYDYAAWQSMLAEQPDSDRHLIFLDDLIGPSHTGDLWAYKQTLENWDNRFFAPIWQALQKGSLQSLTLATDGADGGELIVKARSGRAFWKRKRRFQGNWRA